MEKILLGLGSEPLALGFGAIALGFGLPELGSEAGLANLGGSEARLAGLKIAEPFHPRPI